RSGGGRPAAMQGPQRTVWVLQEGRPQAVEITVGASNGLFTEVLEGALEPGMALITDSLSGGN
ncbi:MAG TPA: efflux RND transporter periplasmic adaptor subunit, partial [Gammaproteobacteria bacterium]